MKQLITIPWLLFKVALSLCLLHLFFGQDVFAETDSPQAISIPERKAVYPVVNSTNSQNSISRNGLSAIFKMRLRKWNDGTPVTVYVLDDDNPLHKQFSKQILNVFPHQLRRAWNRAVFSGSGQAPITVNSIQEMIEKVSSTPGAIGYLRPEDINESIKILNIQ